jgi:hypothetical protein
MRTATLIVMLVAAAVLFSAALGCEDQAVAPAAERQAAVWLPPLPPPPPPSAELSYNFQHETTPARTEYEGEGKKYTRKVEAWRAVTPFGESPGAVIGTQKPAQITEGGTPGVNIAPEGVGVAPQAQGSVFTGGSGGLSWLSILWTKLKDGLWLGGIGLAVVAAVLAVLYFAVPAAQPFVQGVLRAVASIFPFIGSLVERAFGKAQVAAVQKPLDEVVAGGQAFKDLIDAEAALTPDLKQKVKDLFVLAHQTEQDGATQTLVKTIKATL